MKTKSPPLLPLLRSRLQGDLLAATMLAPHEHHSLSDLAEHLGVSVSTVHREVSRLEAAGILRTRRVGKARIVEANQRSPLYDPLKELVLRSFGPAHVIAEEFAGIPGVDRVLIFGSWAARYTGHGGAPPADVDVLVVGTPIRSAIYEAAFRAERRLRRPVNTTIRSAEAWASGQDGFLSQIRAAPLVPVLPADL